MKKLKLLFFIFLFCIFQNTLAQNGPTAMPTVSLTTSITTPTCAPTVVPVTTSFQKGYTKGNYYVVRTQEGWNSYVVVRTQSEWDNYVNYPDKEISPVNFDKQMLVIFPFSTKQGQNLIHIQVSSACVLSDRIQINYSVVGYRNPPSRSKIIRNRSVAVVLPQSNLPVSVIATNEPTPTLVPTP